MARGAWIAALALMGALALPGGAAAKQEGCDFPTAAHAAELADIASLRRIVIETRKYRKWVENGFRIVTSRRENIAPRYKKSFKADVRLEYDFGSCTYGARIRQHGDLKDHVAFRRGRLLQSLDLKLKEGNIANAVRFKLFLEETRSGADEILATELLRRLGMLAPRTRRIDVVQNGAALTMLLQEVPAKEMLEHNGRREGPVLEGDETLIFDLPGAEPFAFEDLALARLVNGKWAAKGDASLGMSLDALARLQHSYARYGNAKELAPRTLSSALPPPPGSDAAARALWWDYGAIMLAMRASHGLRPHNRKFYWNALARRFEPIYYDGAPDPALARNKYLRPGDARMWLTGIDAGVVARLSARLAALDAEEFEVRFRALCGSGCASGRAARFLSQVSDNLAALGDDLLPPTAAGRAPEDLALREAAPNTAFARRLERRLPGSAIKGRDAVGWSSEADPVLALARATGLEGSVATVLLEGPPEDPAEGLVALPGTTALLRHAPGGRVDLLEDGRLIRLVQTAPDDWFVISGGRLGPVRIILEGLPPAKGQPEDPAAQRFNSLGLTGCLTVYDTVLDGTRIAATGGGCEDAINLVSVSGWMDTLESSGAMADAIDMDFSSLRVEHLAISDAGNDCLDVSAGNYRLGVLEARGCGDKALSVGEGSRLEAGALRVERAAIGVSSKDGSTVTLRQARVGSAPTCLQANRKKQEFFGGRLVVGDVQCGGGRIAVDAESVLERMSGQ
ncbi:hypothetical protein BV394_04140 [Brevirhabdus pacifica]|uniref:Uncharacterized protein n=1 Tax=Brevirhabdus pacifica TaxID=1267768 RepID=A0A1U7DG99_9RHOB|nr:hypothetical protein [Brevirhabdus pacifica]APX89017.1 hypothetical protein BV394_04140 [Brevirhabdus pacifica]OWU80231.1 hypothetical protein ATO5_04820 [Loktanella sp. 22II-4b]PJJ86417.1 hypothetical protein CLV77_0963 [Brevirhabdus pacifica]